MSLPLAWLSRTSGPLVSMRLPLSSVILLVGKIPQPRNYNLGAPRVAPIPQSPTKTALLQLLWLG